MSSFGWDVCQHQYYTAKERGRRRTAAGNPLALLAAYGSDDSGDSDDEGAETVAQGDGPKENERIASMSFGFFYGIERLCLRCELPAHTRRQKGATEGGLRENFLCSRVPLKAWNRPCARFQPKKPEYAKIRFVRIPHVQKIFILSATSHRRSSSSVKYEPRRGRSRSCKAPHAHIRTRDGDTYFLAAPAGSGSSLEPRMIGGFLFVSLFVFCCWALLRLSSSGASFFLLLLFMHKSGGFGAYIVWTTCRVFLGCSLHTVAYM